MKILKNNYQNKKKKENTRINTTYPRKLVCENCESELEYEETDLRMGEYGCMFIDCPLCGCQNMLENNEHNITLTVDTIKFPIPFHHVSVDNGAIERGNTIEVRKELQKAIQYFRQHPDDYVWQTWSGNLFVMVRKWDGDKVYEVFATTDFYCIDIPFQKVDYFFNEE